VKISFSLASIIVPSARAVAQTTYSLPIRRQA
jgi:hypothetical protein